MKRALILLGVLLIAVLLGLGIANIPGVLVLELGQKTLAAPLWLVGFGIIILILVIYFVWKLFFWIIYLPFGWKDSWLNFKNKKRDQLFRSAIDAQLLGQHEIAWRKFKKLAQGHYFTPQTYYLAIESAQKVGEFSVAAGLLTEAKQSGGARDLMDVLYQKNSTQKQ